jgi:uncharacterized membrane-anchored protein YjiN (DUF445 family)
LARHYARTPRYASGWTRPIEAVVAEALPWRSELIRFVTAVVRRWEPRSFSDRIEAAVGADLQYMRMNAMVVGGALYLLATCGVTV